MPSSARADGRGVERVAGDDLEARPAAATASGRRARQRTLLAALEQRGEEPSADVAGGAGDENSRSCPGDRFGRGDEIAVEPIEAEPRAELLGRAVAGEHERR